MSLPKGTGFTRDNNNSNPNFQEAAGSVPFNFTDDPSNGNVQNLDEILLQYAAGLHMPEGIPSDLEILAQQLATGPQATGCDSSGTRTVSAVASQPGTSKAGPRPRFTAEELRQRRAARQEEYRKRQQGNVENTLRAIQQKADEAAAVKEENKFLEVRASMLQKMAMYSASMINTLSGLGGAVQEAASNLPPVHQLANVFKLTLLKVVLPADSQLKAMIKRHSIEELEATVMAGQLEMAALVQRWDDNPKCRPVFEMHLAALQELRRRAAILLAEIKPQLALHLIKRRAVPLGEDGRPNQVLRDAHKTLDMNHEQVEALRKQWVKYKDEVEAARKTAAEAVSRVSSMSDGFSMPENFNDRSASAAAGRFLQDMDAAEVLAQYPTVEGLAFLNLVAVWADTLTPLQRGRLAAACGDYLPDPLQLGIIMFEEQPLITAVDT